MKLRVGARLRSQVCTTEVVVLRVPAEDVGLSCGGYPMVDRADPATVAGGPTTTGTPGTLLGKRYTCAAGDIEVLVTVAGDGALFVGSEPLRPKAARPLPTSD
jgi:hypothetical protein